MNDRYVCGLVVIMAIIVAVLGGISISTISDNCKLVNELNEAKSAVKIEYVDRPYYIEKTVTVETPIYISKETNEVIYQQYVIPVTQSDIDLMARVVMSEASVLNGDAKQAIAQVIVNRVLSNDFPNTVSEVVNQKYQFSTQDNGKPNKECYEAVEAALMHEGFPRDMLWFRSGKAHAWGYVYCQIGNTFFTTRTKQE